MRRWLRWGGYAAWVVLLDTLWAKTSARLMKPLLTNNALKHCLFLLVRIISVAFLAIAEMAVMVLTIDVVVILDCKVGGWLSEIARLELFAFRICTSL